jgi:hypothetical protein
VTGAANNQQLTFVLGGGENLAPHPHRHDHVAIAVRYPHRGAKRAKSRRRVEMDARNEAPEPRDARHSEASGHRPRRTER